MSSNDMLTWLLPNLIMKNVKRLYYASRSLARTVKTCLFTQGNTTSFVHIVIESIPQE